MTADNDRRTITMPIAGEILARAEALRAWLGARVDLSPTGHATRAAVIRLAIYRGLEVLEREAERDARTKAKGR
jgi:hypothetical protein